LVKSFIAKASCDSFKESRTISRPLDIDNTYSATSSAFSPNSAKDLLNSLNPTAFKPAAEYSAARFFASILSKSLSYSLVCYLLEVV
jgi:hypothetical protein